MSRHKREPKLVGPWRSVQSALWLIGLAILAWKNWWFPGIFVLMALSLIAQAILMRFAPQAFEPDTPPAASPDPIPVIEPAPSPEHRLELFPAECPKCGGPIRGHEVKWTGPQSADCPYCGVNLPVSSGL